MMRSLSLKDKIVVVTGGSQGIGGGVARAAAESGAAGICITGRDAEKGEKAAAELSKLCPTMFVAGELKDEAFCRSLMAKTEERFKRIDGLVNAAGMTDRGHIDTTSVELWDAIFAVNVRAPFILTQELVRRLKRDRKPGAIVNIITMSSHGGQPFLTAYSTSKGALATLTKNNAFALRRDRIRVNGINMGWADTPGEHAIQKRDGNPADWLNKAQPNQPFGRILRPDDVATLAVYLLSDASEMMTGALIDFDQNVIGAYD